jgi:hypothetical protein
MLAPCGRFTALISFVCVCVGGGGGGFGRLGIDTQCLAGSSYVGVHVVGVHVVGVHVVGVHVVGVHVVCTWWVCTWSARPNPCTPCALPCRHTCSRTKVVKKIAVCGAAVPSTEMMLEGSSMNWAAWGVGGWGVGEGKGMRRHTRRVCGGLLARTKPKMVGEMPSDQDETVAMAVA